MNKWAALYIRVSTDAQFEEGYSVDAQKEMLEGYCQSKSLKNYRFYIDGGFTGANMERPQLKQMIQDIEDKKVSHCVVFKLDRLSRSQKDTLFLIEDVFNENKVAFVSLNETMDTSTPMGKLMVGILSAFAQLERENIRLRTKMGMKERVKNGYWPGGGMTPFGYDYDKSKGILVPNEDAEKVKKIYELYIDGYSSQNIANMLGLKYDRLADQILKRKSNYGVIEYNGEIYQGRHEPIISKEIYDKAMEERKRRSPGMSQPSDHLLTGLCRCGRCGAKMRYQNWGKKKWKLICYSQQTYKPYLVKDPNCSQERLWADEVEECVIKEIFKMYEDSKIGDDVKHTDETDPIELLETQKKELEKQLARLYNLYAASDDDILLDTINDKKRKLEKIKKQTAKEIVNQSKKSLINLNNIKLHQMWENSSVKWKKNIIRSLVEEVVITGNQVKIKMTF